MIGIPERLTEELLIEKTVATIYSEIDKLHKSSEEVKEKFRKRWVWELIQNAVDCNRNGEQIEIAINFDGQSLLTFEHNGKGFSHKNLLSLVTQSSSKQNDENSIGHFGTGFISTSLLSPKIKIDSYIEDTGGSFSITLDRSGKTVTEIKKSIDDNFLLLNSLFSESDTTVSKSRKTFFSYNLNDSTEPQTSKVAILEGLKSLICHMPYLLCFSRDIASISVNGKRFKITSNVKVNQFANSFFSTIQDSEGATNIIFQHFFDCNSFAVPVLFNNGNYSFQEISKDVARLNCKFPLIGTEKYPFPLILNSEKFEVEMDRDGVFDSSNVNQQIFSTAVSEYNELLDTFKDYPSTNLNYLCEMEQTTYSAFESSMKERLNKIIQRKPIVQSKNGVQYPILDSENKKQIFVPKTESANHALDVWTLFSEVPNLIVPIAESTEMWRKIISNDIKLSDVQNMFSSNYSIEDLKKWYGDNNIINWLNEYYRLSGFLCPKPDIHKLLIPNSKGLFVKSSELYQNDTTFPNLIDVLLLIDPKVESHLVYKDLTLPDSLSNFEKHLTDLEVSRLIEDSVLTMLRKENNETRTKEAKILFKKVLELFSLLGDNAHDLFPTLYPDRSKLHGKNFASDLNALGDTITDNNISIEEITSLLSNQELINALSNEDTDVTKELLKRLKHTTNHSIYSHQKVEQLIERSIQNVYNFLNGNIKYVVPNTLALWKDNRISKTIFKATKENRSIFIVIRPSDDDKVIFYYDEEMSVLDSDNYELWIDNGVEVSCLTLGKILEITEINLIPLKQ